MRITNKFNLPQSLVNAVDLEPHSKEGQVSATELLRGAKQNILTRRHWDELEEDVSDRVWALFGTSVHKLLEEKNPNAFTEEKFECKVNDKVVVGHVDLYDMEEACVTDYKNTSVWKIAYKSFDDWRRQGLIYAWLLRHEGLEVKKCRFIAMLRDWSKGEAQRKPDYPQSQVYEYVFDVTDADLKEIEKYVYEKVDSITKSEKLDDDLIAPCTGEERWETETTWAIKKAGRKTALKVCHTKEEAEELLPKLGGTEIEERKGQSKRCSDYCSCNKFCNFYKNLMGVEK